MDKYRHEYKYLIDSGQRAVTLIKARGLMKPDPHAGKDGSYIIRSLYFDDRNDTCFFQNEAGTDPRAKYRIRYYDDDTSFIRLEKKIIGEDAAWIPLFEELHLYCMGDRVQSFTPQWAGFSDFYAIDVVLK